MYGLDISIENINSVKGISNCIINFDYGNFESCQFNARNSLTGGVFSLIDLGHEIVDVDDFLHGELIVTVVLVKKSFDILCDGKCSVILSSSSDLKDSRSDRVLPYMFRMKGYSKIDLELFYRNKGPTRIKAGVISIEMRLYELISKAPPSSSPCTDLENSKIEEEEEKPPKLTEVYVPPESDSSCGESDDDSSIIEFMAQFKPINKAVLTEGLRRGGGSGGGAAAPSSASGHSRPKTSSSVHRSTSSWRSDASASASLSRGRPTTAAGSSGSMKGRPAWNEDVHFEPAPTDMTRLRLRQGTRRSSGSSSSLNNNNSIRISSGVGGISSSSSSTASVANRSRAARSSGRAKVGHYSSML